MADNARSETVAAQVDTARARCGARDGHGKETTQPTRAPTPPAASTRGAHQRGIRGIVTRELPDNKLPIELKVIKGLPDALNREASTSSGYRADQRGIWV
jgi:hypothetical protein